MLTTRRVRVIFFSHMSIIKKLLWVIISIIGAFSLAVVTHIVRPSENVNALWFITAALCCFVVAYRFYGTFIAAKVFALSDKNQTPAFKLRDGCDYHPTNRWVLFGHHFAAIAGAGPLIGPMLAAQFGYLPGLLWMIIGAALGGAVHDMVILTASVRHNGKSLAYIAREEVGKVGGMSASLAILFIIIIGLAGLGLAVVNALNHSVWGTFTIAMSIPIAFFMGTYLYKIRYGKVTEATIIGVSLLIAAVLSGHFIPGSFLEPYFSLSRNTLIIAMAIYGITASILPVWLLLCPRDYLSTYMKIGTITLLAIGVIILAPDIKMPAVTQFVHGGGPIIPGKVFPFMFITIACGAISGFHALIASGTTPKMISSENDIQLIGFGGMLVEGFVSVMALVAATVLIPGDYFAINSTLSFGALANLGFPVDKINELSAMVQVNVAHRPGGAVSLAVGMASILGNIPWMKGLMPYWYNFALMFEALFILTAVDTGTRVARFLVQEMMGGIYKPFKQQDWKPGIIGSSLLVVSSWTYLIYSGNVSTIWPMFGVANQLLAAIALGLGTTIIIKKWKTKYAWITFVPMVFMFITTLTASLELINMFTASAATTVSGSEAWIFKIDASLVIIMSVLAVISLISMIYRWIELLAPAKVR